jgi:predicted Ser/Thr protein kinase
MIGVPRVRVQGSRGDLQSRHHGGRSRCGAPDVHAETGHPSRAAPDEVEKRYLELIKADLAALAEFIVRDSEGLPRSYSDYGQNLFDRYVDYADSWIEDQI